MFEKADWDKFEKINEERLAGIDESQDVDSFNESLCVRILEAASESIQMYGSASKTLEKTVGKA